MAQASATLDGLQMGNEEGTLTSAEEWRFPVREGRNRFPARVDF